MLKNYIKCEVPKAYNYINHLYFIIIHNWRELNNENKKV